MKKSKNSYSNIYLLSAFNPFLRNKLLLSNISLTAFNFFEQIYLGFESEYGKCSIINNFKINNDKLVYLKPIELLQVLIKSNFKRGDLIVFDSTTLTFLIFSFFFQIFKGVKVIAFVTDLPTLNKSGLIIYLLNLIFLNLTFRKVFLTTKMKNKLPLFNSLTIPIYLPIFCQISNTHFFLPYSKYIYYAGSFDEINNIEFLINVCQGFLNKDLKLLIAGVGKNYESLKSKYSNSNISFLGKIEPEYSRFLMRNALILLNFRIDFKKITDYSFPFKIMEYIGSYTPIYSSYISSFESLDGLDRFLNTFTYKESFHVIQSKLKFMIENIQIFREKSFSLYKESFIRFNIQKIVQEIYNF